MMNNIVSIIVPCRNESSFIKKFLDDVFSQKFDDIEIEVIVADGLSDDGTLDILKEIVEYDNRLKYISNPGKIVSTGLNIALAEARGDIIVRMDVHTKYSTDYVYQCFKLLVSRLDITCVGGAWIAQGTTPKQKAIAAAFQSPIGSGGAASRQENFSGWVDTVYLGAWRRNDLVQLGGFDEKLVRNQDDELALRIHRNGGRVWQSSKIRSFYFPRGSFLSLYRQFSQYGYWKIPVIIKHRLPASLRHIAPFVFFAFLLILALGALFSYILCFTFFALSSIYLFGIIWGTHNQRATLENKKIGFLTVLAVATMHIGYAVGFAQAIFDFWILKKGVRMGMIKLTR